ncbi:zona pellucida sperm-binding protein 3-like [Pempheris klunzingeri]|uniref:zona pellucida sperm-binding protein 3-like n=1 Tax=Pempheris klunzingeri TaxID=3127111 RepID=UPI00397FB5C1
MVVTGCSSPAMLLISLAFGVAGAIRPLKDGPMIDAEGREYKTLRVDAENGGSQFSSGSTVHVQCTEATMIIVVQADLYQNGRLVSPEELFLGGVEHSQSSQCRAAPAGDAEYVIEAGLQDCGSELTMSEDSVIYSNKLVISPAASYHGITRTAQAVVPVSCHYKRTHLVSSNTPQKVLTFSTPAKYSTGHSDFSLKLMTDDWTSETVSSVLYLGDLLHLEASYTGPDSGRRRLFIDSCVATLSPDAASVPRYYFIENHGCLTDAKEEGSNTLLQPRTKVSSLQLQLDAFLFHQDPRNSIFITCQLKVTSDMWSSPVNKACNYVHSRWQNVDGHDDACRCCDSACSSNLTDNADLMSEDIVDCDSVTLGPLMIFFRK